MYSFAVKLAVLGEEFRSAATHTIQVRQIP